MALKYPEKPSWQVNPGLCADENKGHGPGPSRCCVTTGYFSIYVLVAAEFAKGEVGLSAH
jgi:hypothetical protein